MNMNIYSDQGNNLYYNFLEYHNIDKWVDHHSYYRAMLLGIDKILSYSGHMLFDSMHIVNMCILMLVFCIIWLRIRTYMAQIIFISRLINLLDKTSLSLRSYCMFTILRILLKCIFSMSYPIYKLR